MKRYAEFFEQYDGVRVANICGSCGKKAVPLAVLGADVTIFDISEENKRYALEAAKAAAVTIQFEVCDILDIDVHKFKNYFDVVFMEGGVLHYFFIAVVLWYTSQETVLEKEYEIIKFWIIKL